MQPAPDGKPKSGAENKYGPDQPLAPAPPSSTSASTAPPAPTPASANFVDPAWRGRKYITPEAFRRRIYAYFGYRPSKSTMHRWLHGGRIAAIRVGKLWFIPEIAWEEFLSSCKDGVGF